MLLFYMLQKSYVSKSGIPPAPIPKSITRFTFSTLYQITVQPVPPHKSLYTCHVYIISAVAFSGTISYPIKLHPRVSKFITAEQAHGYVDVIKLFYLLK
jgi:hypothetical protein